MPTISDEKLARWASSPSDTERTKAENAERAIKKAIAASSALVGRDLKVFAQGSYRNRTNVRADSDVDVCVLCSDTYFFDVPQGRVISEYEPGFSSAIYTFQQYKSDVGVALRAYFGATAIAAGQKAFDIHENTYRIAADAVPCFEYRWYGYAPPALGTAFISGDRKIFNYPAQHYSNGVEKNVATARRFKAIVRVLKHLRYEMLGAGIDSAKHVPSYLLESLVWNVPNEMFGSKEIRQDVISVMGMIYNSVQTLEQCSHWLEVNGIKYLFSVAQPWSCERVSAFLLDAWTYGEFG